MGYTVRVIVAPEDDTGVKHLVIIQDLEKASRTGGTYNALPGGGGHEDEFSFQAAMRELLEETGLNSAHALSQPRELGVIHLRQPGREPHDVCYFEIDFSYLYVRDTIQGVKEGRIKKKEEHILGDIIQVPVDPREFLGSHYAQMREVAPEHHRVLFL